MLLVSKIPRECQAIIFLYDFKKLNRQLVNRNRETLSGCKHLWRVSWRTSFCHLQLGCLQHLQFGSTVCKINWKLCPAVTEHTNSTAEFVRHRSNLFPVVSISAASRKQLWTVRQFRFGSEVFQSCSTVTGKSFTVYVPTLRSWCNMVRKLQVFQIVKLSIADNVRDFIRAEWN